jgi:hypothetical protein
MKEGERRGRRDEGREERMEGRIGPPKKQKPEKARKP